VLIADAFDRIRAANFGGEPGYGCRAILNLTGQFFYGLRPWRFARRMTGTAGLVAGQAWVKLPLGTSRVLAVERDQADTGHVLLIDPAVFMGIKSSSLWAGSTSFVATEEWAPNADGVLVRRLALHRAPEESEAGAYRIAYEGGWTDLWDGIGEREALPVPGFAEPCFGELLEAYTLGLEEPGRGSVSARTAAVLAGPVFAAAVDADMRAVPDVGPMRNGWMSPAASPAVSDRELGLGSPTVILVPNDNDFGDEP
jgi:hypothetical protein